MATKNRFGLTAFERSESGGIVESPSLWGQQCDVVILDFAYSVGNEGAQSAFSETTISGRWGNCVDGYSGYGLGGKCVLNGKNFDFVLSPFKLGQVDIEMGAWSISGRAYALADERDTAVAAIRQRISSVCAERVDKIRELELGALEAAVEPSPAEVKKRKARNHP